MSLFINFITAQDRRHFIHPWIVVRILCGILIDALVSYRHEGEHWWWESLSRMVIIDPSAVSTVNAMEMYMDVVLEIE